MLKKKHPSLLGDISFEDIIADADFEEVLNGHSIVAQQKTQSSQSSSSTTFEFKILKNYGKLSNKRNAVTFALVDWGGFTRYDLRVWDEDYVMPFKGMTFTDVEVAVMHKALSDYIVKQYKKPKYVINMDKTKVSIYDSLCELSSTKRKGVFWSKQITISDWGGFGKKYDFRKWTTGYERCGKGVRLNQDEINALMAIITKEINE